MKPTVLSDDQEVRALAQRLGVWPAIQRNIADGHSGAIEAEHWVITFHDDGLVAIKSDNAALRRAILAAAVEPLSGSATCMVGFHIPPNDGAGNE
ncbi:hypothetical protein [Thioflavicoccus mobilis]|uniref:hypothetical protein n=1 Tax=Thioflavicoccus mobilis TaxID=80679 RepID=UPI0012FBD32C|nr:hypothetical protein [Thioflavicoccus mobilis]